MKRQRLWFVVVFALCLSFFDGANSAQFSEPPMSVPALVPPQASAETSGLNIGDDSSIVKEPTATDILEAENASTTVDAVELFSEAADKTADSTEDEASHEEPYAAQAFLDTTKAPSEVLDATKASYKVPNATKDSLEAANSIKSVEAAIATQGSPKVKIAKPHMFPVSMAMAPGSISVPVKSY